MMKKILILALSAFALNLFALDVYDTLTLTGNATINEDIHVHPGGVIINDGYGSYTLTINGDLINQGSIQNAGGYSLSMVINGNIDNQGGISCYQVTIGGSSPVSLSASSPIASYDLYVTNPNGITASGNISLNTRSHFGNYVLNMNGYDLFIDNHYIENVSISAGAETDITFSNNGYFYDVELTGGNLYGEAEVDAEVDFYGNVVNYGTLQNWYGSTYLDVYGTLDNRGTVRNNDGGYSLSINSYGDIINRSIWTNYQVDLLGTSPQTIYMYDSSVMSPYYLKNYNETSIIAGTDLSFLNCKIDFNSVGVLDIASNYANLNFDGEYFYRGIILSAENNPVKSYPTITGANGFYIEQTTVNDVSLYGTINIWGGVVFEDEIFNYGTIQNASNGSYNLTVNGNFTNYGTVTNNASYSLTIDNYGPVLTNYGTWDNYEITMYGTSQQTLVCGGMTQPFSTYYFRNYNPASILAATDLYFENTKIDLNDSGYVDLTSADLFVSGEYLYRGTIVGTPGVTQIELSNNAYIEEINASDVILSGIHNVWGGVHLSGEIVNNAVLQNAHNASYTLFIDGDLTNNSYIQNSASYSLTMELTGNLLNYGSLKNYILKFTGNSAQNISSPDSVMSPYYFLSSNINQIAAGSDLAFSGTRIDFENTGGIDLSGGYTLGMNGGYIYRTALTGGNSSSLDMSNSCYIQSSEITGDIILNGTILVMDGVLMNGSVINNSTLGNSYSSYALNVSGDFDNNGIVQDNFGYSFTLNVAGDLTNNGTFTNYYTRLNGTDLQYVNIFSPINSVNLFMLSELGTSPFQWYKDAEILDLPETYYENTQELCIWNVEIDSTYFGTYNCETGEGLSRSIILREPVYSAPEITGVFHAGDHVVVQWYQINDADHYDIYSSADPYADPETWTFEGSQNNIQTKIGWIDWMDYDVSANKKFYFVKAVY